MRIYFGWTRGSEVPARYVHLSGRDDRALAGFYGLGREDGEEGLSEMRFPYPRGLPLLSQVLFRPLGNRGPEDGEAKGKGGGNPGKGGEEAHRRTSRSP
ncbi:MAG: hypothetical protein DSO02_05215 [Hadesarchaea archaeon]|nr:MAG: hypothetical protein DSO02_05215 [Hadesarchaea archaeon]